jgi:hypothetical protein
MDRFLPAWAGGNNPRAGDLVVGLALGAVAVTAAPLALSAAGFGAAGVAGGTFAAYMQGAAVTAGSWFAILQSVGMAGLGTAGTAAIVGGATVANVAGGLARDALIGDRESTATAETTARNETATTNETTTTTAAAAT